MTTSNLSFQRTALSAPQVLSYGFALHRLSQRPRHISGRADVHPMVAVLQDIAVGVRVKRIDRSNGISQALSVPEDLQ